MKVLGISGNFGRETHDPAAYLLEDGKILFGVEEERINRIKFSPGRLPERAIQSCLDFAGISMEDVDAIAFPQEAWGKQFEERLRSFVLARFGSTPPIHFVHHHLSHAASAFYGSGFEDSLVVSLDGSGDGVSTAIFKGDMDGLRHLKSFDSPKSFGTFYSLVTQHLGFEKNSEEYKVMSLAAYGSPTFDFSSVIDGDSTEYSLNVEYMHPLWQSLRFPHVLAQQDTMFGQRYLDLFGPARLPSEPITQRHMDLACSAQLQLMEIAVPIIRGYLHSSGSSRLVVAGGVGLNGVLNNALRNLEEIDAFYVPPVASDTGVSLGAAMVVSRKLSGLPAAPMSHAFHGDSYSDDQIGKQLQALQVPHTFVGDEIGGEIGERVAEGSVAGWFQGRMEVGPRALGHRSIIGDPRRSETRERLNTSIKNRYKFQPFAPSVLEEHCKTWFDSSAPLPFMNVVVPVNQSRRTVIPSAVHVDGTARVQTVSPDPVNRTYRNLIERFDEITGVPLVINTSFNSKGEPIVRTPGEAIGAFYSME